MRVLYVGMKYDYGKPEQGHSFEHCNFFDCLYRMGHDILYFDFMTLLQAHGKEEMNRRLVEVAKAEQADLMFTLLFLDELDQAAVTEISENTDTVTLNWFCDDHWRFDNYSRYWAPCFNWVVTTAQSALPQYAETGYQNVIKSQWACNPFSYRKLDIPLVYDVTFIGQPHGNRREIIEALRGAGIQVQVWGTGWDSGRLSQEEMIKAFNQSRINLNLTNASTPEPIPFIPSPLPQRSRTAQQARRMAAQCLRVVPFGLQMKNGIRHRLSTVRQSSVNQGAVQNECANNRQYAEQIKGRNFEVPGCGGFLLTGLADNLGDYFDMEREIACFTDTDYMVELIRHYLQHEEERAAIARAGYERTRHEHTYVHRFTDIFRQMGLPCEPVQTILSGNVRTGEVEEVC